MEKDIFNDLQIGNIFIFLHISLWYVRFEYSHDVSIRQGRIGTLLTNVNLSEECNECQLETCSIVNRPTIKK